MPSQLKDKLLALELAAELVILELAELELRATELDATELDVTELSTPLLELSADAALDATTLELVDDNCAVDDGLVAGAEPEPPPPQALKPTTARANKILGDCIVDTLRLFFSFRAYPIKKRPNKPVVFVFPIA